ncbi:uncharacterized protein SPSK_06785 [Sporothrix schenckii 1099-18]|uniref:Uncharacterized protein n=1 Tax=Sporothrix schenckii 1099-18 TaxID=1397361 RepID=A0A0F2MLE3_SPOSC|nr:uncharacterized protein SPSK_06785 [Sporothrix schenckii 1099-18]KJR89660.1 hypothetical protein SPSK_06785 [Sporothrix schenckii 1099-18]
MQNKLALALGASVAAICYPNENSSWLKLVFSLSSFPLFLSFIPLSQLYDSPVAEETENKMKEYMTTGRQQNRETLRFSDKIAVYQGRSPANAV